jgi:Right handed beta helix region
MSRFLLSLLLATTVPLVAQTPRLTTTIDPALAIVDANASATLQTILRANVQVTDLRIVYSIDGEATIERIEAHAGWTCATAGKTAECTNPYSGAEDRLTVTVRTGATNGGTSTLTMTATSAQPVDGSGGNIAHATLQSFQTLAVETTADAGPGSLRAAIETANRLTKPVRIEFRLPAPVPAEGWFTIIPESPLPPIMTERAFVDGKSQTRFTGDTNTRGPEIAIDGHLAHRGLEIHSSCMARVEGLVLGNFDENQGLWFTKTHPCANSGGSTTDVRLVMDNYIGTDPTGTVAWPNLRGLRGDFGSGSIRNNVISGNTYSGMWIWLSESRYDSFVIEENRIGVAADGVSPLPNGAAGMLLGPRVSADVRRNIIANHPGMGIALVRGETYVGIRENSMRDNGGIGIDWGIDGVSPARPEDRGSDPNRPTLLSATYDAATNRTLFNVQSKSDRPGADGNYLSLDFYANRGPDGDGEQWLGTGAVNANDGNAYVTAIAGDHRGKWINATLTRTPVFFVRPPSDRIASELATFGDDSTSELSNSVFSQ